MATTIRLPKFFGDIKWIIRLQCLVPFLFVSLCIEQNYIMDRPPFFGAPVMPSALPNYFVLKILRPKHRIQQNLQIMARRRVAVQIQAAGRL